jgi:hypothetical protein
MGALIMKQPTRGDRDISWIEKFCLDDGKHVLLTPAQRATLREIYDNPDGPQQQSPVTGSLAAWLALLHVCGPEGKQKDFQPAVTTDFFTVWAATDPRLQTVLRREGEAIICPELGTRYPLAA